MDSVNKDTVPEVVITIDSGPLGIPEDRGRQERVSQEDKPSKEDRSEPLNKSTDLLAELNKEANASRPTILPPVTVDPDDVPRVRRNAPFLPSAVHEPQYLDDYSASARSIRRRGNRYMIREDSPSDEDPADQLNGMINDLYQETVNLSASAGRRATIYKLIYVLMNIFVMVSGIVIGILSLDSADRPVIRYVASVLGFVVGGIGTFKSSFSLEKRATLLKETSNRLRQISRKLKILQTSDSSRAEKLRKFDAYCLEVDELDLTMFDSELSNTVADKATPPTPTPVAYPSSTSTQEEDTATPLSSSKPTKSKPRLRRFRLTST